MKNTHSESDTRAIYIDPQLKNSGWRNENIVREYYFSILGLPIQELQINDNEQYIPHY